VDPKFKLITSHEQDLFEERLRDFVDSLGRDDIIVDVKFSTAPRPAGGIEYSALVHYQETSSWGDS
jgi:hypothetical protein